MIESQVIPLIQRPLDGELMVFRGIPTRKCRSVGPWCFFDKLDVVNIDADNRLAVASHPHIGLQILSWLLKGEVRHQDSLGNNIIADETSFNFMTAGKGIVHTEDSVSIVSSLALEQSHNLHLLQFWLALPKEFEDIPPHFISMKKAKLPLIPLENGNAKLVAGSYTSADFNEISSSESIEKIWYSPLRTYSPLMAMEIVLDKGESLLSLDPHYEYGISLIEGEASFEAAILKDLGGDHKSLHNDRITPDLLLQFSGVEILSMKAVSKCRFMIFGGEPLQEQHYIWWNYVSSDPEKIRERHQAWQNRDTAIFPYIEEESRTDLRAPEIPKRFLSL